MSRREAKRLLDRITCVALSCSVWLAAGGCTITVGEQGIASSFTLAGKAITVGLGPAGIFIVQRDATIRNIADIKPFDEKPSDAPESAAVSLRSSSVIISPIPGAAGKNAPTMQANINGNASLRLIMDNPGTITPCQTGREAGSFDIQVSGGVATGISGELALDTQTIDMLVQNDIALCMELSADFDGVVEVQGLDFTFGAARDDGAGNGSSSDGGSFLATSRAMPGEIITLNHAALSKGRTVNVEFTGPNGYAATVATTPEENGLARVAVPVFIDTNSGNISAGQVTVAVAGTGLTQSLTIEDLPEVNGLLPGEGLLIYLDAILQDLEAAERELDGMESQVGSSTEFNAVRADLEEKMSTIADIMAEIENTGQLVLDDVGSQQVTLDAEALALADRTLYAGLLGMQSEISGVPVAKLQVRAQGITDPRAVMTDPLRAIRDIGAPGMQALGYSVVGVFGIGGLIITGVVSAKVALIGGVVVLVGVGLTAAATSFVSESSLRSINGQHRDDWQAAERARKILLETGQNIGTTVAPQLLPVKLQPIGDAISTVGTLDGARQKFGELGCDGQNTNQKLVVSMQSIQDIGFCSAVTRPDKLPSDDPNAGCADTCLWAFDGLCDDGADGSEFALCDMGTDCTDCGRRELAGVGACCLPDGSCMITDDLDCETVDGSYAGDETSCVSTLCDDPTGACCMEDGSCTAMTAADCDLAAGTYQGDDVDCAQADCPEPIEWVIWHTSNVCCWGAPLLFITDRAGLEADALRSSFPGGGIDPVIPVTKAEMQGGFASYEDAQAWLCPQFVSKFNHRWCGSYIQGMGGNWQVRGLCDTSQLPFIAGEQLPDVDGCQSD